MDSGNYALALRNYDISIHQPHPPGYFLYVMLGRLVNFFVEDANLVFVSISVLFSGLSVVVIFHLAKEMFDNKTAIFASILSITSPNLWFHGEVALSYGVEAFFSTLIAYYCWKIYKGEQSYLWWSVIALGIASGVRQNTAVFLLPMWLFCVKHVPPRKLACAFILLLIVCLSWFLPMVEMTGGLEAYSVAFKELWVFNTGNYTVFDKGFEALLAYSITIVVFIIYGLGSGTIILGLSIYTILRNGYLLLIEKGKVVFVTVWLMPSLLFYVLVFIHPANPGYILIILPGLIILTAVAISYITDDLIRLIGRNMSLPIVTFVVGVNVVVFIFTSSPVSFGEIKNHDQNMMKLVKYMRTFNPNTTAIFTGPYIFLGYRQIMYYLPEFHVYQMNVRKNFDGQIRKTYWGVNRETHISEKIIMPSKIDLFVKLVIDDRKPNISQSKGIFVQEIFPNVRIFYGQMHKLADVYPELNLDEFLRYEKSLAAGEKE